MGRLSTEHPTRQVIEGRYGYPADHRETTLRAHARDTRTAHITKEYSSTRVWREEGVSSRKGTTMYKQKNFRDSSEDSSEDDVRGLNRDEETYRGRSRYDKFGWSSDDRRIHNSSDSSKSTSSWDSDSRHGRRSSRNLKDWKTEWSNQHRGRSDRDRNRSRDRSDRSRSRDRSGDSSGEQILNRRREHIKGEYFKSNGDRERDWDNNRDRSNEYSRGDRAKDAYKRRSSERRERERSRDRNRRRDTHERERREKTERKEGSSYSEEDTKPTKEWGDSEWHRKVQETREFVRPKRVRGVGSRRKEWNSEWLLKEKLVQRSRKDESDSDSSDSAKRRSPWHTSAKGNVTPRHHAEETHGKLRRHRRSHRVIESDFSEEEQKVAHRDEKEKAEGRDRRQNIYAGKEDKREREERVRDRRESYVGGERDRVRDRRENVYARKEESGAKERIKVKREGSFSEKDAKTRRWEIERMARERRESSFSEKEAKHERQSEIERPRESHISEKDTKRDKGRGAEEVWSRKEGIFSEREESGRREWRNDRSFSEREEKTGKASKLRDRRESRVGEKEERGSGKERNRKESFLEKEDRGKERSIRGSVLEREDEKEKGLRNRRESNFTEKNSPGSARRDSNFSGKSEISEKDLRYRMEIGSLGKGRRKSSFSENELRDRTGPSTPGKTRRESSFSEKDLHGRTSPFGKGRRDSSYSEKDHRGHNLPGKERRESGSERKDSFPDKEFSPLGRSRRENSFSENELRARTGRSTPGKTRRESSFSEKDLRGRTETSSPLGKAGRESEKSEKDLRSRTDSPGKERGSPGMPGMDRRANVAKRLAHSLSVQAFLRNTTRVHKQILPNPITTYIESHSPRGYLSSTGDVRLTGLTARTAKSYSDVEYSITKNKRTTLDPSHVSDAEAKLLDATQNRLSLRIDIPRSASMFGEVPPFHHTTLLDLANLDQRDERTETKEGEIGENATQEGTKEAVASGAHGTTSREKRGRNGTFGAQQMEAVVNAGGDAQADATKVSAGRYRGETYGAQQAGAGSEVAHGVQDVDQPKARSGRYRGETYGAMDAEPSAAGGAQQTAPKPRAGRYRGETYGAQQLDAEPSAGKTGGYRSEIYYEEKREAILKMETRGYEGHESSGTECGDEFSPAGIVAKNKGIEMARKPGYPLMLSPLRNTTKQVYRLPSEFHSSSESSVSSMAIESPLSSSAEIPPLSPSLFSPPSASLTSSPSLLSLPHTPSSSIPTLSLSSSLSSLPPPPALLISKFSELSSSTELKLETSSRRVNTMDWM